MAAAFLASGTKYLGETIALYELVYQNGDSIFAASNDVADRPAYGIAVLIDGDTIHHTPFIILDSVTINGTPAADNMDIYLGVDGQLTFDSDGATRTQKVGYVIEETSSGSDYKIMINIGFGSTDTVAVDSSAAAVAGSSSSVGAGSSSSTN